jgi:phospholipid/cholesterol/gamma-HCH transport system permease protein
MKTNTTLAGNASRNSLGELSSEGSRNLLTLIGHHVIEASLAIMDFFRLAAETLVACVTPPFRLKDTIAQFYFVANQSILIVCFCVTSAAAVTIVESSYHMKLVIQNDSLVPGFAALLILRELGSVVMALLITSRVGAGLAAEVASMQVTEQVDALKMLGINPIRFIVVPRFIACLLAGFVLAIVANLVCLFGAMLVSTMKLGYTYGSFITAMRGFVHFQDLVFAGIKGAAFGSVIPLFSCFFGFRCKSGAEGVGLATTNSVVATSVAVIVIDFCLTYVFTHFY